MLKVPETLDLKAVAPLLCPCPTYSPLRHWQVGQGQKVGVVGLGGLGHMAIKLAKAMGACVTVFMTSPEKETEARHLGADDVVLSTDQDVMGKHELTFGIILDTIPTSHDINAYVNLLRRDATLTLVAALEPLEPGLDNSQVAFHRRSVTGSLIGGIAETQEMLDFCAEHWIVSDVEIIPIQRTNESFERMLKGDVKYRFVIDMASLNQDVL